MILGEVIQLRALQVEHADYFTLVNHRNRQFRARFWIHHQIPRDPRSHPAASTGCFQRRRRAHNAFARRRAQFPLHPLAMLHDPAVPKHFLLFVIQHDAQDLIIDDPLDLFRCAPQQFFHIQNRTRLAAHFIQQQQRFRLRADLLKQSRIVNGDSQPARQQRQNALLLGREVARVAALNIQHADAFALQHQRHSQFGTHAFNGIDVARIFARYR